MKLIGPLTIHKLGSNKSVRNEENDDTLIWQFKNELQITIHSTSQCSIKSSVNKYSTWFTQCNTLNLHTAVGLCTILVISWVVLRKGVYALCTKISIQKLI